MFEILTDLGIISQYQDTNIETLEAAEAIAEIYAAQGRIVEIYDMDAQETVKLYNATEE